MLDERESASFIGSSFYLNSILITVLLPALHNATRLLCSFIVQLDDNFAKNLRLSTIGRMSINYFKILCVQFWENCKMISFGFSNLWFLEIFDIDRKSIYVFFFFEDKDAWSLKTARLAARLIFMMWNSGVVRTLDVGVPNFFNFEKKTTVI